MAAGEEFVRAKHEGHGGVASLPKQALAYGHFPGWVAVDGPLPSGPKSATFPKTADEQQSDETADEQSEETPSAADKSAKQTKKE